MKAVLAVLAAAAALPTAAAEAATVRVTASTGAANRTLTVTLEGATRVTVARSGASVYVAARTSDTLTQTGSGCSAADGGLVCGAESTYGRVVVNGSSGADEIELSGSLTRASTLDGNGGNDSLTGGSGADALVGDTGNDVLSGGLGNDDLTGSPGDDVLVGQDGDDVLDGGTGRDVMSGGGQSGDTLEYAGRTAPVRVDLTRFTPQGEAGEHDEADGFAVVLGGSGPDTLIGSDAAERLEGNGGADFLLGAGGDDALNGGAGDDTLAGDAGADALGGGEGDDTVDARDGGADGAVACGGGRDRLAADAGDPASTACEVVAPIVSGELSVAGEHRVGGTLTAAHAGAVSGTASTLTWRWQRCTPAGCAPVGEGQAYTVTEADAGTRLQAVLRADNEAGAAELASTAVGPIPAPQPAAPVPTPAPARVAPTAAVRSVRCDGRRCRVTLAVTGAPASVRVTLTRGGRTIASATRRRPPARSTLTVTARRTLAPGRYVLRVTAPGSRAVTRVVRVR